MATGTKENCDIRAEGFLVIIRLFLNAILEKQSLLVWVEPEEGTLHVPIEGWYETSYLCAAGLGGAARTSEALRNWLSKAGRASGWPES